MAKTPVSLLLLRRLSHTHKPSLSPPLLRSHGFSSFKPFSISPSTASLPTSTEPKTSLSARMSFVFDQIDAIEKERSQKDDALQRIRAWCETKNKTTNPRAEHHHPISEPGVSGFFDSNAENSNPNVSNSSDSCGLEVKEKEGEGLIEKQVELVHPWREWVELMERLVKQNYFDHRRKDEEGMVRDSGFEMGEVAEEGLDFTRDFKTVQNACINFGRDRFDIMRSLSRQDIQLLVGYGCPNVDKKVIFSAKLLRKYVHLDEGDVCSSCSLRSSCERAYLLTNKEDEARTLDVMRILLTYGFDSVNGSVVNKSLLKKKPVKTVIRKLLHEVVRLSAIPIDPNLPPPIIKRPPPKVKIPPPPPKKRVGRDDIEMKKGDWLCPKCDFMNFAKNTVCLQCDAKRPRRQLLPGEWECPECNFLNYRRNTVCFHCDCKRPPDEYMEKLNEEKQHSSKLRSDKVISRQEVSNAWNFDFDDAESDGADVAAFEYADSPRIDEELDGPSQGRKFGEPEENCFMGMRSSKSHGRDVLVHDHKKPGVGFDDFDDEDDDLDNYELDNQNSGPVRGDSRHEYAEERMCSDSEDFDGFSNDVPAQHRISSSSSRQSKRMRRNAAFSESTDDSKVDSDEDLPVHPNWKSSHAANSGQRRGSERARGPSRGMNFGSREEHVLDSDSDDDLDNSFSSRQGQANRWDSERGFRRGASEIEDGPLQGSGSDDDLYSHNKHLKGKYTGSNRRGNDSNGSRNFASARQSQFRSDNRMANRGRFSGENSDDSPRRHGIDRGPRGDYYGGRRLNDDRRRNYIPDRHQRNTFESGNNARSYRGNNHGERDGGRRFNDDGDDRRRNDGPDRHQRNAFESGNNARNYRGNNHGEHHGGRRFNDDDRRRNNGPDRHQRNAFESGNNARRDRGNNHGGRRFDRKEND